MTDNGTRASDARSGAGKPGGFSWGIAGFVGSLLAGLVFAFLFMLLALGGLGGSEGGAYAGLAALFVGVLICLGTVAGLGVFLLIFFLATGRRKALAVAVGQIVLAGIVMALFLAYIAS